MRGKNHFAAQYSSVQATQAAVHAGLLKDVILKTIPTFRS
jgi:hypothetical protein